MKADRHPFTVVSIGRDMEHDGNRLLVHLLTLFNGHGSSIGTYDIANMDCRVQMLVVITGRNNRRHGQKKQA